MSERPNDDLFAPSLEQAKRPGEQEKPWRLSSQFWVAFFGGPLATAVIAHQNAARLALDERRRMLLIGVGVAGLVLAVVLAVVLDRFDTGAGPRFANQAAGVICYGAFYKLQRPGDRVYQYYSDLPEETAYASLTGPGAAAVFGLGIPSILLIVALTGS